MVSFYLDLYISLSLAVIAVLQLSAYYSKNQYVKLPINFFLLHLFSITLLFVAYIIFFHVSERNIGDVDGGLNANQQAIVMLASAITGFIITSIMPHCLNNVRIYKNINPKNCFGLFDWYSMFLLLKYLFAKGMKCFKN
jgi:hypothetical protein